MRRSMPKTSRNPQAPTFESALAELEALVASMEGGQLPLEQAVASYRRGAELLQYCQNALKEATQQVRVLEGGVLKDLALDGEETGAAGEQ